MSASLRGKRELPVSQYDLGTYMGRVRHAASITDPSTLFTGTAGLEAAKKLVTEYKMGKIEQMTPALWQAKKVMDSTLHPDTGEPIFLPFRMSCYVLTNLVTTAGMLQPGMGPIGIVGWPILNQFINVAFNTANGNKSASVSVALGLNALVPRLDVSRTTRNILGRLIPFAAVASAAGLNTYLMRRDEIIKGIDVRPVLSHEDRRRLAADGKSERDVPSLGKSQTAAKFAVYETAASRVFTSSPIMIIPPLMLYYIEKQDWYRNFLQKEWVRKRPVLTRALPVGVNLALITVTSFAVLPFALAVFPQLQEIDADILETKFHGKGDRVEFNRGL
ncbi:putative mitochondrial transport protein fsf1 [Fusarium oxysporum f. sp. raphani]|uniref:Putative mitochondrial transport protein fsf1 n=1 Tax=Fusarium oxysporum f. sp. raphani TaxID=96318 RepID=A0A8J5UA29_FUSOX|nr:putative mitochondrial transport protein fsf1 [Fusarium oxysporum f. sp. raphani]